MAQKEAEDATGVQRTWSTLSHLSLQKYLLVVQWQQMGANKSLGL